MKDVSNNRYESFFKLKNKEDFKTNGSRNNYL